MKKLLTITLAFILVLNTFSFAGSISTASASEPKILEFDTMIGVPRPYTGATNAIRGVPGGGRPWVIGFAKGELKTNGELELKVRGLVIDPNEPIAAAGTNPAGNFKAIVSCMSKDASGNAIVSNVETPTFPTDLGGNTDIEATVTLPQPCIAPIIFVTSGGGSWFAATGF